MQMLLRCALAQALAGTSAGSGGSLRRLALTAAPAASQQLHTTSLSSSLLWPDQQQQHQQQHARVRAQQQPPPPAWAQHAACTSGRSFASEASGADSSTTTAGFTNLPRNATVSGYPQAADAAAVAAAQAAADAAAATTTTSSSGVTPPRPTDAVQLPPEVLRVALRREEAVEEAAEQVDAYSISRALVGDMDARSSSTSPAAATQQQQQQLTPEDAAVLEKLVGILTKDGKKSRARRILLDAMHIIKQQLAKGQGQEQQQQRRDAA